MRFIKGAISGAILAGVFLLAMVLILKTRAASIMKDIQDTEEYKTTQCVVIGMETEKVIGALGVPSCVCKLEKTRNICTPYRFTIENDDVFIYIYSGVRCSIQFGGNGKVVKKWIDYYWID